MLAQLCPATALRVSRRGARVSRGAVATRAVLSGFKGEEVPDMEKRNVMNLLLVAAIGLPATAMLGPYAVFFYPPSSGGGGGGVAARDAQGNNVKAKKYIASHAGGGRELAEGLKGDATYLVVDSDNTLSNFGINAVCTHLGCVVPWNIAENKFKCPCHGSQYDNQGKVVRGPAPLSLALAHVTVAEDDSVLLTPWTETDFRTGLAPWWH